MFVELLSACRRWDWEQNSRGPVKNADKLVDGQEQISLGLGNKVGIPLVTRFFFYNPKKLN